VDGNNAREDKTNGLGFAFDKINAILEPVSEISVAINSAIYEVYLQKFRKMQFRKKTDAYIHALPRS
jgi:hypothetical protein